MKTKIYEVLRSINCFDIRNTDWDIHISNFDNYDGELVIYDSNNDTSFVLYTLRKYGYGPDRIEEMECGVKKHIWDIKIE